MANELKQQIMEDSKTGAMVLPATGPNSGSRQARLSVEGSPRYPGFFLEESTAIETESKEHLEEIKRHFVDTLGMFQPHLLAIICRKTPPS